MMRRCLVSFARASSGFLSVTLIAAAPKLVTGVCPTCGSPTIDGKHAPHDDAQQQQTAKQAEGSITDSVPSYDDAYNTAASWMGGAAQMASSATSSVGDVAGKLYSDTTTSGHTPATAPSTAQTTQQDPSFTTQAAETTAQFASTAGSVASVAGSTLYNTTTTAGSALYNASSSVACSSASAASSANIGQTVQGMVDTSQKVYKYANRGYRITRFCVIWWKYVLFTIVCLFLYLNPLTYIPLRFAYLTIKYSLYTGYYMANQAMNAANGSSSSTNTAAASTPAVQLPVGSSRLPDMPEFPSMEAVNERALFMKEKMAEMAAKEQVAVDPLKRTVGSWFGWNTTKTQ